MKRPKHRMRALRMRAVLLCDHLLSMQWFPVALVGPHGMWVYAPQQGGA